MWKNRINVITDRDHVQGQDRNHDRDHLNEGGDQAHQDEVVGKNLKLIINKYGHH